jgi:hypothetical protein
MMYYCPGLSQKKGCPLGWNSWNEKEKGDELCDYCWEEKEGYTHKVYECKCGNEVVEVYKKKDGKNVLEEDRGCECPLK